MGKVASDRAVPVLLTGAAGAVAVVRVNGVVAGVPARPIAEDTIDGACLGVAGDKVFGDGAGCAAELRVNDGALARLRATAACRSAGAYICPVACRASYWHNAVDGAPGAVDVPGLFGNRASFATEGTVSNGTGACELSVLIVASVAAGFVG